MTLNIKKTFKIVHNCGVYLTNTHIKGLGFLLNVIVFLIFNFSGVFDILFRKLKIKLINVEVVTKYYVNFVYNVILWNCS